jgi:hypothetical protein
MFVITKLLTVMPEKVVPVAGGSWYFAEGR